MDVIKVAARSHPPSVAGAIAAKVREQGCAHIQAIGARAVYQALRAIIITRHYLQSDGLDVDCIPMFVTVEIEGRESSAVRIVVQVRSGQVPSGD